MQFWYKQKDIVLFSYLMIKMQKNLMISLKEKILAQS